MKILLITTVYLMSGPLDCSDMTGFSGGSIIMISDIQWDLSHTKYICKMGQSGCNDLIRFHSQSNHVQYKRFLLYKNTGGSFLVLIRRLKPQDAGQYIFGVEDQSNYTVNLKVRNDASCGVSKILSANLGQNITITCKYPGEYEKNNKYVITMNDEFNVKPIIDTRTTSEDSRFSISDDKSASVLSLNMSNVSEADDLFYLFGVWNSVGSVGYYTYFTEIQLHVTGTYLTTSAPRKIQSGAVHSCNSAIISVCVGEALLLIGAFALIIYKLRHKRTCGSTIFTTFTDE